MAPKSVGLNDSPWENHSSSRERRRFCVSRAWRCSSQRTAIFILLVLLLLLRWEFFFRWFFTFVFFGQKLERGSFFLSDDDSESVWIYILSSAAPFADTLSSSSRALERERDDAGGARVFINVALRDGVRFF